MRNPSSGFAWAHYRLVLPLGLAWLAASCLTSAQAPAGATAPAVPDWALPGSPTHTQVPPPADFHRASTNFDTPIGVFDGPVGHRQRAGAGQRQLRCGDRQYTINSAGYNIWYSRDEFRYLWKKMSRRRFARRRRHVSRTPTVTATAKSSSSSARISTTTPRKPWSASTARA